MVLDEVRTLVLVRELNALFATRTRLESMTAR